jgi:uncharacterized protein YjiS (DUF1127 family)
MIAARAAGTLFGATISDAVGAIARRIARARTQDRARRELERLDDATLRDIGLSRAEIGSAVAEVHGRAERTRRRLPACRDLGG